MEKQKVLTVSCLSRLFVVIPNAGPLRRSGCEADSRGHRFHSPHAVKLTHGDFVRAVFATDGPNDASHIAPGMLRYTFAECQVLRIVVRRESNRHSGTTRFSDALSGCDLPKSMESSC